jgi:hypothetical protein
VERMGDRHEELTRLHVGSRTPTSTFLLFVLTALLNCTTRRSVASVESDLFVHFLHFR